MLVLSGKRKFVETPNSPAWSSKSRPRLYRLIFRSLYLYLSDQGRPLCCVTLSSYITISAGPANQAYQNLHPHAYQVPSAPTVGQNKARVASPHHTHGLFSTRQIPKAMLCSSRPCTVLAGVSKYMSLFDFGCIRRSYKEVMQWLWMYLIFGPACAAY